MKINTVYRKPHATEKTRTKLDEHTNPKVLSVRLSLPEKHLKHHQIIDLYGNLYSLDKKRFRIVNRTKYEGRIAYKLWDKFAYAYRIYSPFYNKLMEA